MDIHIHYLTLGYYKSKILLTNSDSLEDTAVAVATASTVLTHPDLVNRPEHYQVWSITQTCFIIKFQTTQTTPGVVSLNLYPESVSPDVTSIAKDSKEECFSHGVNVV